ncbi:MAG TPA: hypothetical protein VNL72_05380 [Gammaproteobacteria bacterium]|nr:hypothetical protein [Gammaproteobacteria bacterium]
MNDLASNRRRVTRFAALAVAGTLVLAACAGPRPAADAVFVAGGIHWQGFNAYDTDLIAVDGMPLACRCGHAWLEPGDHVLTVTSLRLLGFLGDERRFAVGFTARPGRAYRVLTAWDGAAHVWVEDAETGERVAGTRP